MFQAASLFAVTVWIVLVLAAVWLVLMIGKLLREILRSWWE